ncbi:MAG TPA: nitrate- and nitrite sensing domain-containing protein [Acidimicrobiales bacterium]|nr:nitrate- and nitrite sensing domain-containing protein [Acidimicrobiales bacterium]
MTDRPTPTLDEVEDRLRRTFATRADDMSPGGIMRDDTALDVRPPGGGLAGDRMQSFPGAPKLPIRHQRRRPLVAAAAALLLVAAAAGAVVWAGGDGDSDDSGDVAAGGASTTTVGLVVAPRDVAVALQSERTVATMTVLGLEDAIALPAADTVVARGDTDAAISAFAEVVAASPAADVYQSWLDSLDALAGLRSDLDPDLADPDRNLDDLDTAVVVSDRYSQLIDDLLDAQAVFALSIDDPGLRAGAEAYGRGLALQVGSDRLFEAVVFAQLTPLSTTTVAELSRWHLTVQRQLETLAAQTMGTPYEDAAATAVSEAAGLVEVAEAAIEGEVDVPVAFDARDQLAAEAWPVFLDRVEALLATG